MMYTSHYFDKRQRLRTWQNAIGQCWASFLGIKSIIDIGCGNGYLLEGMKSSGAKVLGFDPNYESFKHLVPEALAGEISKGDFSSNTGTQMEFSMSVEVAEHIPSNQSEVLVELVCKLAAERIIFSAAPPGQPGTGHINCQPREYWIRLFESRGAVYDKKTTDALILEMEKQKLKGKWYSTNLLLFRK